MTVFVQRVVFKPRRRSSFLSGAAVLLSLVFVATGLACFRIIGPHPFSFAFTIIGLIVVSAAVGSMFTRTVVTSVRLVKRPIISGGFSFHWNDVESWEQAPRRFEDAACVRFRVRGSRTSKVVFDYEVENPGFDRFLSCVRLRASQKEIVS